MTDSDKMRAEIAALDAKNDATLKDVGAKIDKAMAENRRLISALKAARPYLAGRLLNADARDDLATVDAALVFAGVDPNE